MPKASEIKKNTAIEYHNSVYIIRDIERSVPQGRAGGSLYRMRMYDVVTGAKIDETFKDVELLNLADFIRRDVLFSYIDGDEYVFMDNEDYTPYHLNHQTIAEEVLFVNESTQGLQVMLIDGKPVGLELPASVELQVIETDPSIKGASATSRNKPAKLSTGVTIQVPEYISTGDMVKVNTAEHKFMSRGEK